MDSKKLVRVDPGPERCPAGRAGKSVKAVETIFVRVFGVDALPLLKVDRDPAHPDRLTTPADEIHFDSGIVAIVNRKVREGLEIEIGLELAVDPDQEIEIEFRGDSGRIVVRGDEDAFVLFEVDADDETRVWAENPRRLGQEFPGLGVAEVADRRARKETDPVAWQSVVGQAKLASEIGLDRRHFDGRKAGFDGPSGVGKL